MRNLYIVKVDGVRRFRRNQLVFIFFKHVPRPRNSLKPRVFYGDLGWSGGLGEALGETGSASSSRQNQNLDSVRTKERVAAG